MVFTINDFEGPLDLLLHLIKEDNIDICDISIARITEQYLGYISKMQSMNLDIASEYLVLAAELIEIKSKTLLPGAEAEEIIEEFKEEIVEKLIDYKQYKEVCEDLKKKEEMRSLMFDKEPSKCTNYIELENEKNVGCAEDLFKAFENVLLKMESAKPIETKVTYKEYSVYERSREVINIVRNKKRVCFSELFTNYSRDYVIVTFLSILDLARNHQIFIEQDNNFNDIFLVGGEAWITVKY